MGIKFLPGQTLTRAEVNQVHGGGIQGGILTPAGGVYAFVFSDIQTGHRYGYTWDGWEDDRHQTFFYTGEGSNGDQDFRIGGKNKTLLDSIDSGREIHLFEAVGRVAGGYAKKHLYHGQFRLNQAAPFRREDSADQSGLIRSVIVFRMDAVNSPADNTLQPNPDSLAKLPAVTTISVDIDTEAGDEAAHAVGPRDSTTATRREKTLERAWQAHLRSLGHDVKRRRISVEGHANSLTTDTWDATTRFLYEAKGTSTRESVRMAVGQLLDYRRHIAPAPEGCYVLLPNRPSNDLISFLGEVGIGLVFQDGNSFVEYHVD